MTRETKIAIAIMNNKKEYEGIKLPTPQTAGTDYQRETYARIKAREVIEQLKTK